MGRWGEILFPLLPMPHTPCPILDFYLLIYNCNWFFDLVFVPTILDELRWYNRAIALPMVIISDFQG
ncbi:hypothetical protein H1Q63_28620 [Desmonostoc muscorum CCALA 125]|nr:hypothetical protein [Desmonostoc muscorum CCALA 125]